MTKPNFALAFDGPTIELLYRGAGGWRRVGNASALSETLPQDMAALRTRAETLEPEIRTMVVLPEDQVSYLSVPDAPGDLAAQQDLALAVLEGATPHAVGDLVIDLSVEGSTLHIAAIAKDTLDQAEAFASDLRLQPVRFTAATGGAGFLGAPDFGSTAQAEVLREQGERFSHDEVAVVVTGNVIIPKARPEEEDIADLTQTDPAQPDADDLGSPDVIADPTPRASGVVVPPSAVKPRSNRAQSPSKKPEPKTTDLSVTSPSLPESDLGPAPAASARSVRADRTSDATDNGSKGDKGVEIIRPAPPPAQRPTEPPARAGAPLAASSMSRPDPAPGSMLSANRDSNAIPLSAIAPRFRKAEATTEGERMAVFGQRGAAEAASRPGVSKVTLTIAILVLLTVIALAAVVFSSNGIARLWDRDAEDGVAVLPPELLGEGQAAEDAGAVSSDEEVLTDADAAVLDALRTPDPIAEQERAEAEARYAVSGIWELTPEAPEAPGPISLESIYIPGIDRVTQGQDAVALPELALLQGDASLNPLPLPPPAGFDVALDAEGRVIPTETGALSPDGFTVFLGRPPVVPPRTPARPSASETQSAETPNPLSGFRPRLRPEDLVEQNERTQLGGLSRTELASLRPRVRPLIETAETQTQAVDERPTEVEPTDTAQGETREQPASALAVRNSVRPDTRPRNMARIVRRAQRNQRQATTTQTAAAATVAPRRVQPTIPSSASVARAATVQNAINLRRINLLGVSGRPSNRKALVRLGNGRLRSVQVGDRIDGGRVAAIGTSELRYTKGGRNVVLRMPAG